MLEAGLIKLPTSFNIVDVAPEGMIAAGVAVAPKDKRQRLEIVTDRYLRQGYIKREDLKESDGIYVDKYEESAIPLVAKIGSEVVASIRLVPKNSKLSLPILNDGLSIEQTWERKIDNVNFELSQLAKSMRHFRDSKPIFALFRTYTAIARYLGEVDSLAVIDSRVRQILNGHLMRFNLPAIGPNVFYMGSESVPVYVNCDNVISNVATAGLTNLSRFLETGKADEYEWYQGQ